MHALVDAQNLDRRIQEVGTIYRSLTGSEIRPRSGREVEIPPEKDAFEFLNERMQLLLRALGPGGSSTAAPTWVPTADVVCTDEEIVVSLDLPGVARADVTVAVVDGVLLVQGERRPRANGASTTVALRTERPAGRFVRSVPLGAEAVADRMEATLVDGVLTVRVARSPLGTEVRNVEIR